MAQDNRKLKRKVRNSYIISTISIALVLFLLGTVGYLILNALQASDRMKESITVNVMIRNKTSEQHINSIRDRLTKDVAVKEVKFVSKEAAAADFKQYIGSDFEQFLQFNPLPDTFELKIKAAYSEKDSLAALEAKWMKYKGVEEVVYQRNMIEQITANLNKFNLVLFLFGATLLFISLILLNNTIRVSIYSKRYMISTMKLVGATRWFILRPFIGSAIAQGIYAAIIASLMFLAMIAGLSEGLPEIKFLTEHFQIAVIICFMLAGGIVISMTFTIFAVNKFVNMHTSHIHLY